MTGHVIDERELVVIRYRHIGKNRAGFFILEDVHRPDLEVGVEPKTDDRVPFFCGLAHEVAFAEHRLDERRGLGSQVPQRIEHRTQQRPAARHQLVQALELQQGLALATDDVIGCDPR